MKFGIRITQPRSGDIYTVSYDPVMSNIMTPTSVSVSQVIVDLLGDLTARSFTDQLVLCADVKHSLPITRTELYLMVLLRRNTADKYLSPSLTKFVLAAGTQELLSLEDLNG
jgi:hypothetical protein